MRLEKSINNISFKNIRDHFMSIRRLKKLSGLNESVADDPHTNSEIERRLDELPSEMRTSVLDALDVLKSAGHTGLTVSQWAERIRQINGDSEMPLADVLKTTVKHFPIVVKKLASKTYAWEVVKSADDEDFDPEMMSAVGSQVELTHMALAFMKSKPEGFTVYDLKTNFENNGVPHEIVDSFVDHLINHFHGMLVKQGDRYKMKPEASPTRGETMQSFRDMVVNPKSE